VWRASKVTIQEAASIAAVRLAKVQSQLCGSLPNSRLELPLSLSNQRKIDLSEVWGGSELQKIFCARDVHDQKCLRRAHQMRDARLKFGYRATDPSGSAWPKEPRNQQYAEGDHQDCD